MSIAQIVNDIIEAYISVMGRAKWESLTGQQQHDVIMSMANSMLRAMG